MKQMELAQQLGISKSYLSMILKGERSTSQGGKKEAKSICVV